MRITMSEYLQGPAITGKLVDEGIDVTILVPDETYEVSEDLGKWILDNHKGVKSGPSKIKAKPEAVEASVSETKPEAKPEVEGGETATAEESKKQAGKRGAK